MSNAVEIAQVSGLPKDLAKMVWEYYNFRPVVEQIANAYLTLSLGPKIIEDLNMTLVIERTVSRFEDVVQNICSADKTIYPWVIAANQDSEDTPAEIQSWLLGACYSGLFLEMFPIIRNIIRLVGDMSRLFCHLEDMPEERALSAKYFDALISFANGNNWVTPK